MAQNKNQHFVPRAHLAPFSANGEGKAINVLNLKAKKLIPRAPVRGQCARHYFYSDPEDLRAEKVLQDVEGLYAETVRRIGSAGGVASAEQLDVLRLFTHIQLHRTEGSVERFRQAHDLMRKASQEGPYRDLVESDPVPTERQLLMQSMRLAMESRSAVADLRACIVINDTSLEFVTSDDPAIFTNRYAFEAPQGGGGNFGYINTGGILLLPLTPRLLFLCYDADAYRVARAHRGSTMTLTRPDDVEALNELQFIKAARNVYFCSWDQGPRILVGATSASNRRQEHWSRTNVLVARSKDEFGGHYTQATVEERQTATEKLITVRFEYPRPSRWLSTLKVSQQPKCIDTRTAVGIIRPGQAEFMRRQTRRRVPRVKRFIPR